MIIIDLETKLNYNYLKPTYLIAFDLKRAWIIKVAPHVTYNVEEKVNCFTKKHRK